MSRRADREIYHKRSRNGSADGHRPEHFVIVQTYDFSANALECEGPLRASSESLSHAALYECSKEICAVVHAHHRGMWERLLGTVPSTAPEVAYGTPAMAREILRVFRESSIASKRLFAMAGHADGIMAFGATVADAATRLLEEV